MPQLPANYLEGVEILEYPTDKDKTDSQLALELALERNASYIEICGGWGDEIDHALGNVFLLELVNRKNKEQIRNVKASFVTAKSEVLLVEDDTIVIAGAPGDILSVLSISEKILLQYDGLKYPAPNGGVVFGSSLTLRNVLVKEQCRINVKGKALIIHLKG